MKSKTKSIRKSKRAAKRAPVIVKPRRVLKPDALVSAVLEGKPISEADFVARLNTIIASHVDAAVTEAKTIGRPSRTGEPTRPVSLRATDGEIDAWRAAAEKHGLTLVAWAREHLNSKAGV